MDRVKSPESPKAQCIRPEHTSTRPAGSDDDGWDLLDHSTAKSLSTTPEPPPGAIRATTTALLHVATRAARALGVEDPASAAQKQNMQQLVHQLSQRNSDAACDKIAELFGKDGYQDRGQFVADLGNHPSFEAKALAHELATQLRSTTGLKPPTQQERIQ